jgi:hypothetical protein
MRWIAALGLLCSALLACPALAQTTTFNASDCDPSIVISGAGLTVSQAPVSNYNESAVCQANTVKYHGQWYFRAVIPSAAAVAFRAGVGVARPGWSQTVGLTATLGAGPDNAGYVSTYITTPVIRFNYSFGANDSAPFAYTAGNTMAVAVNLDTNPLQIWVTPDIADTSGCGGGPVWNADTTTWGAPVAAAPATAHYPCGGPGTGTGIYSTGIYGPPDTGQTGIGYYLPGSVPVALVENYSGTSTVTTFDFTDSATLDAKIPGYLPWNTVGGNPSPGPGHPMVQNVADAPAWQQNTPYTSFPNDDRVLAGPAYDPTTGVFTNGQPLYLWAVAPQGGGTSGNNSSYAGHFGTAPCPSPANVGGTVAPGGYFGSPQNTAGVAAWNGATQVSDGGVTWVCLTSVDYNTFTGMNVDDPVSWASGAPFFPIQYVVTAAGNVYRQSAQPTYPAITCTTGSTAPSATAFGGSTSDGSCVWVYEGTLGYSSKANVVPHQLDTWWTDPATIATIPQHDWFTYTHLWWGGAAQTQYVNGAGGEAVQIFASMKLNQPSDTGWALVIPGSGSMMLGGIANNRLSYPPFWAEFTVAPGDSFQDNMNPASDPLRYDPSKGVAIFSNQPYANVGFSNPTTKGFAYAQDDWGQTVQRFQMQSINGGAVGQSDCGPGNYNGNGAILANDILDSGGAWGSTGSGGAGLSCGDAGIFHNVLAIFRGTGTWATAAHDGAFGAYSHYGGAWYNNTLIGPGISVCPLCSALESDKHGVYGPTDPATVHNNLGVGFGQQLTYWTGINNSYIPPEVPPYSGNAGNNGSDLPSNYAGHASFTPAPEFAMGNDLTAIPFPGGDSMTCGPGNNATCFALDPDGSHSTGVFVHPNIGAVFSTSEDWRLCTVALCGHDSPAIGAGVDFSYVGGYLTPGPDMYGQARTRSGSPSIDLGAVQASSAVTPPPPLQVPGGGFRLFR